MDHYRVLYGETDIINLVRNANNSGMDSLIAALVVFDSPRSLADTLFIPRLKELGYHYDVIPREKFNALAAAFDGNNYMDPDVCSSEPMYTDLIIFKDHSRVTGMAKFSLGCGNNYSIEGKIGNARNGVQVVDIKKLRALLPL